MLMVIFLTFKDQFELYNLGDSHKLVSPNIGEIPTRDPVCNINTYALTKYLRLSLINCGCDVLMRVVGQPASCHYHVGSKCLFLEASPCERELLRLRGRYFSLVCTYTARSPTQVNLQHLQAHAGQVYMFGCTVCSGIDMNTLCPLQSDWHIDIM